jgi:hypothetical protein
MKIFLSWSGRTSREAATALARFIPIVLQRASVYVPDEQIETGGRWYAELADAMRSADFGIACLTKDNINNPWLAFEIGALSARLEPTRVVPVLVDFSLSELTGPLATFQAVKLEKADMRRLLAQINEASEVRLARSDLDDVFEHFWPRFEEQTRFKLASTATSTMKGTASDERDAIRDLEKLLKELKERIERLEKKDA